MKRVSLVWLICLTNNLKMDILCVHFIIHIQVMYLFHRILEVNMEIFLLPKK